MVWDIFLYAYLMSSNPLDGLSSNPLESFTEEKILMKSVLPIISFMDCVFVVSKKHHNFQGI